jgi:hypothetical protein
MPVADWLLEAAPSLIWGAVCALVYAIFLAGVHSEARRRLRRFVQRRRALERVESWYPRERLLPASVIDARSRLAAERRDLERAGILRRDPGPPRAF